MRRAALGLSVTMALGVAAPPAAGSARGTAARSAQDSAAAADVVRIPFPSYDGTLTPYTFKLGYSLMTLVYDTLLWRDAQGMPRPWLARSPQRSRGGRRLTLRLREGVRWHDGRPLTAADVAFTLRFVARRFHPRFTPQLANVERVGTRGRRTVVIDLRRPSLGFPDQPLADLPILPEHIWRGLPRDQVAPPGPPIGSGPYRLVRESASRGYGFRANRAYFRGAPTVARLDVPIIRDAQRTYRALANRDVDMLPGTLSARAVRRLRGSFGIDISRGPSYSGTALMLNVRRRPFNRPAARRAVSSALDLERLKNNVEPAVKADRGYLHPASPWASAELLHRFDAGAARRAFVRLGLDEEVPVLAPDNDAVRLEAGRQVVLALKQAGARARLVESSATALGRATGEGHSRPAFTAAIVSIPALASYDPDLLGRLFGARARRAGLDVSGYRSAAFGALAERVAAAGDRRARRRAVQQLLERLAREVPAVPLFFSEGDFAYRRSIYDGWFYVKGLGILDKRSFLQTAAAERPDRLRGGDDVGSADNAGALDVLSIVSLIVLVGVVGLGAVALGRSWRSRRT